jgi:hypothetical protein
MCDVSESVQSESFNSLIQAHNPRSMHPFAINISNSNISYEVNIFRALFLNSYENHRIEGNTVSCYNNAKYIISIATQFLGLLDCRKACVIYSQVS